MLLVLAGCATPSRTIAVLPGPGQLPPEVAETGRQWLEARGMRRSFSVEPDGTVAFVYGSPDVRRMTREQFRSFVEGRLLDQTIVSVGRPSRTSAEGAVIQSIGYYSPAGRYMHWIAGAPTVQNVHYELRASDLVDGEGVPSVVLVCYTLDANRELCKPAYDELFAIYDRRKGDPFSLARGVVPALAPSDIAGTWPDGSPLVPAKARHD
jgi:hypothetical protein